MAVAARRMLAACSSAVSSGAAGGAVWAARGIRKATTTDTRLIRAASRSTQLASVSVWIPAPNGPRTTPARTAMSASRELASTRAVSSSTTAGTSALLATR
jgi:hypothetical protein